MLRHRVIHIQIYYILLFALTKTTVPLAEIQLTEEIIWSKRLQEMGYTCEVEGKWETRQQGATLKIIQLFCPTMKSNPRQKRE